MVAIEGMENVDTNPAPYVSQHTVHGEQISVYDRGRGSPLVMIHGMFGDFSDWEPVLEPLSRTRRVIAVDLIGFGDSSKPRREYDGNFHAAALRGLFERLQLGKIILTGNSFGGQIAILYSLAYPETVEKLVLVDSGGFRFIPPEEAAAVAGNFGAKVLAALTPEVHSILFASVFSKASPASQHYIDRQNQKLKRNDYPAYAEALAGNIQLSLRSYLLERLPEIACPTLLIWGGEDRVLPVEQAEQALARLQRGELKVIPGCGHAPQLECPEEFLRAITPFL
jgi:pimeloyl-ACP methyl ester carboxylesterase